MLYLGLSFQVISLSFLLYGWQFRVLGRLGVESCNCLGVLSCGSLLFRFELFDLRLWRQQRVLGICKACMNNMPHLTKRSWIALSLILNSYSWLILVQTFGLTVWTSLATASSAPWSPRWIHDSNRSNILSGLAWLFWHSRSKTVISYFYSKKPWIPANLAKQHFLQISFQPSGVSVSQYAILELAKV